MTWRAAPAPPRLRRLLVMGWVALLWLGLVGYLALRAGAADPPRAPQRLWHQPLPPLSAPDAWTSQTLSPTLPPEGFTLGYDARWSGEGAWGLWLQTAEHRLYIGVHTAGYRGAWHCTAPPDDCAPLTALDGRATAWRAFPHIRAEAENRLRVHQADGALAIRINQEIVWHLPYTPPAESAMWGTWSQGGQRIAGALHLWGP